ncbi:hypothetical protein F2Q69_00019869 [Brassica cretica]|uniref:Uncharacterized protein n=1 Tax=Brassica cretica TaxID=69181 RepID=A0A8S9QGJ0_BRACR|nr:hypothetical protein F2Q69_00019869 [Brassica cretica]
MFSSRLVHAITMKIDGGSCGISSDEGTMETMMNRGSRFLLVESDDSTCQIVTALLQ